jgi:hypothetical protein
MYRHQGYNYVGIPAFTDYAHIKAHYESVAPIRGRTEQTRPIGRRRYDWYEIREKEVAVDLSPENPLGTFAKSYCARLYQTDCVEWFPNNDIVIRVSNWKGPTTMGMLTYSLASHGSVVSASGKWYFRNKAGEDFLLPTGKEQEMLIRKADDGMYRPSVIPKEYKYKVKRKELNQIAKVYKDFTDYARTMLAIDDKVVSDFQKLGFEQLGLASSHLTGTGYWARDAASNRGVLLQKVIHAQANNDLEVMYKLGQYCAYAFGRYAYRGNVYTCTPQAFEKGFKEVLKYVYHDQVFEVVEQPQGVAFYDRNAKYVQ